MSAPLRIVSLVPSMTETLVAWGLPPVACTRFCEQPELAHVGGTKDPDVAAIVSLAPDLVIVDAVAPSKAGVDAAEEIVGQDLAPVVVLVHACQPELTAPEHDTNGVAFLPRQFVKSELLPAMQVAAARFAEARTLRAQVADATERERAHQVVRRAKELMIAQQHMTEVDAADWLRRAAARRQTALHDIAGMVVDGLTAPV